MSEQRQVDPAVSSVDQAARTQQGEPPVPQVVDVEVVDPEDYVAQMKRQLAELQEHDRVLEEENRKEREARRRAEDAQRQAEERARQVDAQARTSVDEAQRSTVDTQLEAIAGNIQSRTAQQEALKRDYAAAGAEGDFAKMADIQANMAAIAADIRMLENGKAALETRKATPTPSGQPSGQPSEHESQENFIRQQPPIVQDWLRSHRAQYFGDPAFQQRVAAAAGYAANIKHISGNSQEFIDFVETEVGLRQAPPQRQEPTPQPTPQPAPGQPANTGNRLTAAPVSNSAPGVGGGTPTQVYLSPAEKSLAHDIGHAMGWTNAQAEMEYAKGKLADTGRDGRSR